ncbi:MAG: hypothetical protein ACFCU5_20225 [Pleurocapsa sp.]
MVQIKRWESPRHSGRNDKGKGGSARARQIRKQQKMLRKKLKQTEINLNYGRENTLPSFLAIFP